jgi:hypothetical protein
MIQPILADVSSLEIFLAVCGGLSALAAMASWIFGMTGTSRVKLDPEAATKHEVDEHKKKVSNEVIDLHKKIERNQELNTNQMMAINRELGGVQAQNNAQSSRLEGMDKKLDRLIERNAEHDK